MTNKTSLLGLVVGSLLLAGCGGAASLCNDICDCEGCSDSEYDDCIDNIEDQQKLADDEGCGDQADDLLSCLLDEAECREGNIDLDGCSTESKNLGQCLN